ncbi:MULTISPECIES: hypothetical protein [unclassified Ensifer]|uniref:hypothetical protein n=1 Tax=unclassified Ensifer TaxID=2633371 RepID=UPI00111220CF|nr:MULTISPECIES: hypothetical protein [unclassified Ensifer]
MTPARICISPFPAARVASTRTRAMILDLLTPLTRSPALAPDPLILSTSVNPGVSGHRAIANKKNHKNDTNALAVFFGYA